MKYRRLIALLLFTLPAPVLAQTVEARAGVLLSMPLVEDAGGHVLIGNWSNVELTGPVKLSLAPTPLVSLSLLLPLREKMTLELGGTYGLGKLVASDTVSSWDVQNAGLVSAVVDVRYQYSSIIDLMAGVGGTKFFSESKGVFAEGSGIMPLIEVGAGARRGFGPVILSLDARLQTHTFGTPALRRDGASDGKVMRGSIQLGVRGAR
jgi:hypothetical protein